MDTSYEKISKGNSSSQGKTDANLANDSNHLGGIPAEDFATHQYVHDYHNNKEQILKEYIENQDNTNLETAKEYANSLVRNQDFSDFAKASDITALNTNLTNKINSNATEQKNYTDNKVQNLVNDVNSNFEDVNSAIDTLNNNQNELFQSVSDGKSKIAEAITDKGVTSSASDTFQTMANNIKQISTTTPGEIPEGYVDTSDATADASKILSGYSAYANGNKIYGTLKTPNYYEENPSNPYPIGATVGLVYGIKDGSFERKICYDSYPNVFAISCDRRIMAEYDSTNQKIIMRANNGENIYVIIKNQEGDLLTPEYTLSDLGIELNDDLEVSCMEFSVMNSDTNFSAYDCNLAIGVRKKSSTITDADVYSYYIYVYRVHTMYGTIKLENKETTYEIDGETHTSIELNHYKIVSTATDECKLLKIAFSSSDYMKFAVASDQIVKMVTLFNYRTFNADFSELDIDKESNYMVGMQFINNSRIIVLRSYNGTLTGYIWEKVVVLDSSGKGILKTTYVDYNTIFSENALYAINNTKLYNVIIDYSSGNISITETGLEVPSISSYGQDYLFDKTCKYLIYLSDLEGEYVNARIYEFSGFNPTDSITCLYEDTYSEHYQGIKLKALPDYTTFSNFEDLKTALYYGTPDDKKLIGLNYNGQMFYSNIYDPGVLTAKQEDVKKDKTYIGYTGIPETGTMEVTE